MKYSILSFGIVAISCIILAGCATTKFEPRLPPRETVTFDYTPPDYTPPKTTPDSTRPTIGVIKPRLPRSNDVPMFTSFARGVAADLEEVLIACGYDVKGPFDTFQNMSYAEKQGINGLLLSTIEFDILTDNVNIIPVSTAADRIYGNPNLYRSKGSVTVDGEISLELIESPVSETLSKKTVTISPEVLDVASDQVYDWGGFHYREVVKDIVLRDDKVHSDLERTLKTQYDAVMGKIYHYFSSNDFAELIPKIEPPRMNLIFDYIPKKTSVGSTDITFSIVNTHFDTPVPMFKEFAENMTKDFQEILTGNGYRIKGLFKNHDEMTYSDKEGSNLVLMANVDFSSDTSQLKWNNVEILYKSQEQSEYYRASGSIAINCHINLILYESLTRERMWTKSLAITPLVVPLISHEKYPSEATLEGQLEEDNQFHADLGKALQSQYNEIMSKIEAYLDPREMKILNKQVQDLRKMKVFQ